MREYTEVVTDEVEGARDAGLIVTLIADRDCENPRENTDVRDSRLWFYKPAGGLSDPEAGEEFDFSWSDFGSYQDFTRAMEKASRGIIILPVYKYEHSGVAYNTTGFHCPWDSGLAGLIYVTAPALRERYGTPRLRNSMKAQAREGLAAEVAEYSAWASGDCWGVRIERGVIDDDGELVADPHAEPLEEVWGHVGRDWALQSAAEQVKYYAAQPDADAA